jgi:fluoroacetyl-CoA thioesterase
MCAEMPGFPAPARKDGPGQPLTAGGEHCEGFVVEGALLTDVGGTLGVAVLSTPGMIAMMERTAAILAYERLPEGTATVGFEVCVKHVGAATEGSTCTAVARLTEIVDDRKLFFDVEVREAERTIGVGTHQRRVVPIAAADADA